MFVWLVCYYSVLCVGLYGVLVIFVTGTLKLNIGIRASRHSGKVEEDDAKTDRGLFNRFRSKN